MKKNTRTLLITLISFVVVFTVAIVAYNMLQKSAPAVSFTPTLTAEASKPTAAKPVAPAQVTPEAAKPVAPAQATPEADTPVAPAQATPEADTPVADQGVDTPADAGASKTADQEKGPLMPNLPLTRLDGTITSYAEERDGRPVVINYFASWCPPCKQELPHFQQAFDEYGDQVSFIFLNALDGQRETLKTITAFIESFPFTGPVFYDSGEFAMTFGTTSLPTTVFLDREGRVVKGYLGYVPEEVLYADIAQLLD